MRRRFSAYFLGMALFNAAAAQAAELKGVGRPVSWTTPDGVQLKGLYRAIGGPRHRLWMLLHGLGSNKQEWVSFAAQLAQQGEGFLIYDARGHGDSVQGAGIRLNYQDFRTIGPGSQWQQMIADAESAVAFLKRQYSIDPSKIAVGGASLGANVALAYASMHPKVPALILLSPGLKYAGIESEAPFRAYAPRPVFMAASPGDTYAYASVLQLASRRTDRAIQVEIGEKAAHGVALLDSAFTRKLLDWMNRQSR